MFLRITVPKHKAIVFLTINKATMATDNYLLERISYILKRNGITYTEKRMFGGHCFLVDDKMLIGSFRGNIMARVNPEKTALLCKRVGASQMIHGGKKMTGFLTLMPESVDMEEDLEFWIDECLEYNPLAKSSKKKKK